MPVAILAQAILAQAILAQADQDGAVLCSALPRTRMWARCARAILEAAQADPV